MNYQWEVSSTKHNKNISASSRLTFFSDSNLNKNIENIRKANQFSIGFEKHYRNRELTQNTCENSLSNSILPPIQENFRFITDTSVIKDVKQASSINNTGGSSARISSSINQIGSVGLKLNTPSNKKFKLDVDMKSTIVKPEQLEQVERAKNSFLYKNRRVNQNIGTQWKYDSNKVESIKELTLKEINKIYSQAFHRELASIFNINQIRSLVSNHPKIFTIIKNPIITEKSILNSLEAFVSQNEDNRKILDIKDKAYFFQGITDFMLPKLKQIVNSEEIKHKVRTRQNKSKRDVSLTEQDRIEVENYLKMFNEVYTNLSAKKSSKVLRSCDKNR